MNVIEEVECICGTTVEISEFHLGLRGETVSTKALCPMCGRTLYEVDIDGMVLGEVVLPVERTGVVPPKTFRRLPQEVSFGSTPRFV